MRICIREPLTANRTYYVRTDGNNNNTGLVDDAAGAFLTIQKAVDVVCDDLDMGPYTCVIQVGPGTYPEAVALRPFLGSRRPILRGDTTTPSNVTLAPATGNVLSLGFSLGASVWHVEGLKFTSTNGNGIVCATSSSLSLRNLEFGACAQVQMIAIMGGLIDVIGSVQISGGVFAHLAADTNGTIRTVGNTVTITGTPAFSQAFARATRAGAIQASGMTFVGTATGRRYEITGNSVIDTAAGGANYFPGNIAGAALTGGEYI